MPFITAAMAEKSAYDVIVVGSGAAGGQSAYTLTMEGARVLMLEAGRKYDPLAETPMFHTPEQAPLRGASTSDKVFGFYDATVDGGWELPGEPYVQTSTHREGRFDWWRSRMLGGRTNHWDRVVFRNGPYDFKGRSRDGLGFDWPISYAEMEPYYDKLELLIGVYGANDGLENTPNSAPGCLLPPPKPLVSSLLVQKFAKGFGIPVIATHRAVLTQQLDWKRSPARLHPNNPTAQRIIAADMQRRAACIWATPCMRGCSIRATYQSTTVHLPPALETGKLDIVTDAMAYEVTLAKSGRASGVVFVDKDTGKRHRAKTRAVVLAASAYESVRILLNSKSSRFPEGLANSSGKVGRYLTTSVGAAVTAQIPRLESLPPHNEDRDSGDGGLYMPWWMYKEQLSGKLDFARGYHTQLYGGRRMPEVGSLAAMEWLTEGAYGKQLKEDARRYFGSFILFQGCGEMIPNEQCYCEIAPGVKDKWDIPVLRFHWKWSPQEIHQVQHMHKTWGELIDAMGGRVQGGPKAILPDQLIHEVGGAIMGTDRESSVTNRWCQTWDVDNVFIADGAPFPSHAHKNPTLTIMANAWRVSDYILKRMRQREL